ncbi:type VII secretion target [Saccharopolyspora shandongensis]|uniref:type VII secretion target n=1 Tax=Saccharopolyspora shandongensis TaxID=418495 RepID=UPI00343055B8
MLAPPAKNEVEVATGALRSEADIWDEQADSLGLIASQVVQLRMGILEAGPFFLLTSAYDEVVDLVHHRCREGSDRAQEVAGTLRQVADTYEREDEDGTHAFRNLY